LKLVSILPHKLTTSKDGFGREEICSVTFLPWVKIHGYNYVIRSLHSFQLPQSLVLWARWEDAAAGQRPAVGALLYLDLLVLLHQSCPDYFEGKRTKKKKGSKEIWVVLT
jgi:hypothetical protein